MPNFIKRIAKKSRSTRGILTLIFVNINNFIGLSEKCLPEVLIELIKEYIRICKNTLIEYSGQLIWVEGDCVLGAFVDNPNQFPNCELFLNCAVDILRKSSQIDFIPECFNKNEFSITLSLSRGECIYEEKGGLIQKIYGMLESNVIKINKEVSGLKNVIAVDNTISQYCKNHSFQLIKEDFLLFVDRESKRSKTRRL